MKFLMQIVKGQIIDISVALVAMMIMYAMSAPGWFIIGMGIIIYLMTDIAISIGNVIKMLAMQAIKSSMPTFVSDQNLFDSKWEIPTEEDIENIKKTIK